MKNRLLKLKLSRNNVLSKSKKRYFLFSAFCISLCLIFVSQTKKINAQENAVNLTVTPPVSYLHVAPGTATNHTIILENSGETEVTVLPTIVDFTTDGISGKAIVTNELTFPYITMGTDNSVKEVTVPPGKKAQLSLYITIPNDALEKEYPLTILFFTKNKSSANEQNSQSTTNSQISAAIGSNLIVLVAKQNVFSKVFSILDFNAPLFIDSFQKVDFAPIVKNESFGAVSASGSAKIVNWRKQTVAEFAIYPDVILGHNSRELRALLSELNPEKPELGSFSYKPQFLIGPYQILVTLTNERGEIVTQKIHVFYAVPVAILLTILIGISISIYFTKTKPKTNHP